MRILIVYLVLFLLAAITVLATSRGSSQTATTKPADESLDVVVDEDSLPLADDGSEPGRDEGLCIEGEPDCEEILDEGPVTEDLSRGSPMMTATLSRVRG